MSNIEFTDKTYFEKIFKMSSGYVLDFTNATFQDFVYEKININIYKKYPGISKAKILRAIIKDYDNKIVGTLLLHLLDYKQKVTGIKESENENFIKCVDIANRLVGKKSTIRTRKTQNKNTKLKIFDFDYHEKKLIELTKIQNAQQRGFVFEKYLKKFFEDANLNPNGSFKLVGEQIDGSFVYNGNTYLLEAKWQIKECNKSDLIVFDGKVSSKSRFTRGLFISYSGFSQEALKTFPIGRNISIILIKVEELSIMLNRKIKFNDLLEKKLRCFTERGQYFEHINNLGL